MEKVANFKFIVYETVNIINGKIYVGVHKTTNPDIFDGYIGCGVVVTRPSSYNKPKTAMQYAVNKYGTKNFKRTTLRVFDTPQEAYELESQIVTYEFINRSDTYNMKLGGSGGCLNYVKVYQFDESGKLLKEWPSIIDAADFLNVSDTAIRRAFENKGSCCGYFWSLTDDIKPEEYTMYKGQYCYQYNEDGKLIDSFESIQKAAKETGIPKDAIQRAIKAGYKTKGYYFDLKLHESYQGQKKVSLKKKTLYVYNLQGEFLAELKNSEEICKYFDIKTTWPITSSMRCKRPYKDYQLSLEKLDKMPPVFSKKNTNKPIMQYDLTGNFIKEFSSITEAVKEFGATVQRVLKGQQKQTKGYVFRYKEVNDIV
jgi:hypothetical protein